MAKLHTIFYLVSYIHEIYFDFFSLIFNIDFEHTIDNECLHFACRNWSLAYVIDFKMVPKYQLWW